MVGLNDDDDDDDYQYPSANDLNVWNGAALLCADCLGTGLLALPHDITVVLGSRFGLFFLILQLPINLYAGSILSDAALFVETNQQSATTNTDVNVIHEGRRLLSAGTDKDRIRHDAVTKKQYHAGKIDEQHEADDNSLVDHGHDHDTTATFDFIGMTAALFDSKTATRWAVTVYYTNIFLVLGNYIVVMSHAVTALIGEDVICIPTAGILASTLMFAVCQMKTMARLGRSASAISLTALGIVVAQCLYFSNHSESAHDDGQLESENDDMDSGFSLNNLLRQFSAMGSIGFAVGSQKLFLNIRHEFADRKKAPQSLAVALAAFGSFYVGIVLAAGPKPPGFLFDAIPSHTFQRRIAGLFLWVHVVVSYAINSQAICSSMDRVFFHRLLQGWGDNKRWMLLTGMMAATAFFVANAIPFFKDLVAFIGSLTSVPLTLLLPAVFYRRVQSVHIWCPTTKSLASYSLLAFSSAFMVTATLGSIYTILTDWENHTGGFFSCH
ncbi:MAG: hypothetical protein SGILL_003292 [Bacillariaceae sp.]